MICDGRYVYDPDAYRIGRRMREMRIIAGITQGEAAKRAGTSAMNISQWETCLRNPKIEMLPVLAEAYGCEIKNFFEECEFF